MENKNTHEQKLSGSGTTHSQVSNNTHGYGSITQLGMTGTVTFASQWSTPERISVNVYQDKIEMIYKQISMVTLTVWPSRPPAERVFKVVYSCVEGKWNASEPIYGTIVAASGEYYNFEE